MSEMDFDKVLGKIRKLLERADHPNTPEGEAASCRTTAERLMRDYRVSEEAALAVDPATLSPELVTMVVASKVSPFWRYHSRLAYYVAQHTEVKMTQTWVWNEETDSSQILAKVVGYPSDLKLMELMFTSARLVFSQRLEPSVDANLSEEENVYRLRSAGIERHRVATLIWGVPPNNGPASGKVAKIYKAECERRGETPALDGRQVNAKTYRETYAEAFTEEIWSRLARAREGADSATGSITLHGRKERVEAEFYRLFPELRPAPAGKEQSCEKCRGEKKCRDHKLRKPTQADIDRYERMNYSVAAQAGRRAGASAAREVALDGSEPAKRLDTYDGEGRETARAIRAVLGN